MFEYQFFFTICSSEALSRYDIYVNASKIYSQSWVGPESFIYNAGLSQTIREKCPYVYTCFKNAWGMSNDVCGTYVDLSTVDYTANSEFDVKIPIKINLHQFLLLSSMRYLPSFCGRWEIELYPNWNNMVVLPVHPAACGHLSAAEFAAVAGTVAAGNPLANGWKVVSKSFTQIGEKFTMINTTTIAAGGTTAQCLVGVTDPVGPTPGAAIFSVNGTAAQPTVTGTPGTAYTVQVTGTANVYTTLAQARESKAAGAGAPYAFAQILEVPLCTVSLKIFLFKKFPRNFTFSQKILEIRD
jgi:hypothetical protein